MEINTHATKNAANMILFERIKTDNPLLDTLVLTFLLSIVTGLLNWINNHVLENISFKTIFNYEKLCFYFSKKNVVEYEGKISCSTNIYDNQLHQSAAFSDRFRALWDHIINNIENNNTIYSIKEHTISNNKRHAEKHDNGIYLVNQNEKFLISKKHDIYAYTYIHNGSDNSDKDEGNKKKTINKTDHFIIELYSYKSSIQTIKVFVDDITNKYISSIEHLRENKQFIYTLSKIKYDDCSCECWDENIFESIRTFDNMYFDAKNKTKTTLDFFLKNKPWYFEKGIPYSLGIGMYGPPGTGKTSLAKAIANYTGRHIVCISLKLIKTKKQLDNVFFEERYSTDNKRGSITFDKKIILFEDIDCIGDIVLDREKKKNNDKSLGLGKKLNMEDMTMNSKVNMGDLIETISEMDDATKKNWGQIGPKSLTDEPPITLDDILTLWDGVRETPGRIMILSSNHYDALDAALKRPGRIDITLELSFASRQVVADMYHHLFKPLKMADEDLEKIQDKFYSPAEIINIYMNEEQISERFITRLQMNQHV
uniref:AAA+ ATPase domain-containing protein n=1 Tax=viral metagenome TaxID=1070528 RepID=A0A6C0I8F0_9ZZZZ